MSATPAPAAAPIATAPESVNPVIVEHADGPATEIVSPAAAPSADAAEKSVVTTSETASPPKALQPDIAATPAERDQAVERIRKSTLPPALRDRLAAVVAAGQSPQLDVAACLEAIEETLPDFLRDRRIDVAPSQHPIGNAFFHGTNELTDAEAETLATKQLERSGLLRGQRVRVGD